MNNADIKTIQLLVNSEQAAKRLDDLKARLVTIKQKKDEAFEKGDATAFALYSKEMAKTQREIAKVETKAQTLTRALHNLDKATPKELRKTIKQLTDELNSGKIQRGSKEWNTLTGAIREAKEALRNVNNELSAVEKAQGGGFFKNLGDKWAGFAITARGFIDTLTGAKQKMEEFVNAYAQMEEAKANVRKYTGLTKEEVDDLNESLQKMDTRTSREQLNALAGDAGRLGITAKDQILEFVQAADIINVALGDDLGDGAVANVGKLAMLFEEDRRLGLKDAMLATASTINELAQNSSAAAGYLEDFTARVSGVGKMAGLSQAQIMGFAAVLDENMQQDETAATAFAQLLAKMYSEPAKFAKYAGKSVKEFSDLLRNDANEAVLSFFANVKAQGGFQEIAPMLEGMGLSGTRATSVLTTIADKLDNVRKMQEMATKAYQDGTSAVNEFTVQNSTAQAELDKAKNRAADLAAELGEALYPAYTALINGTGTLMAALVEVVKWLSNHKTAVVAVTATILIYNTALKAQTLLLSLNRAAILATIQQTTLYKAALNLAATAQAAFHVATTLMTKGLTAARIEFALLKAAMAKHPFGLIAIALATVVGLLLEFTGLLDDETEKVEEGNEELSKRKRIMDDLKSAQSSANEQTAAEIDRVKELIKVARDENATREERIKAINELNRIAPDWHGTLDTEGRLHERNARAIDNYIAQLKKKALAEALYERLVKAMGEKADADLAAAEWDKRLVKYEQEKGYNEWDRGRYQGLVEDPKSLKLYDERTDQVYTTLLGANHTFKKRQEAANAVVEEILSYAKDNGVDQMLSNLRRGYNAFGGQSSSSTTTTTTTGVGEGRSRGKTTTTPVDPNKAAADKIQSELLNNQVALDVLFDQRLISQRQYLDESFALELASLEKTRDLYAEGTNDYNKYQKQIVQLKENHRRDLDQLSMQDIERQEREEQEAAMRRFADGEISEEQYNRTLDDIKLRHLQKRADYYKSTNNEEKAAEYELQVEEETNRQKLERRKEYLEQAKKMEQEYFAKSIDEREQMELALLDELITQGVIAADKKAEYEAQIRKKYNKERTTKKDDSPLGPASGVAGDFVDIFKRLEDLQDKIKDGKQTWEDYAAVAVASLAFVSSTAAAVSQLFTAQQQEEENAINQRYDAEIKKAGENTTKGKKLEEKKQKELAKVKQKYNKKAMAIEIAQAVASTAMAAINAYASASKENWVLGPIAAAMATAAGMIQIATIKKQHEAQQAGYYSGGFTGGANYRREAGVVHEGEFVANHEAVNNPNVLPVLRLIDNAQRNNTIASLTAADVSRAISAPQAAAATASSAPAVQVIDTANERTANAIERLNQHIEQGIHASVSITGDDGIERQMNRYNDLKKRR